MKKQLLTLLILSPLSAVFAATPTYTMQCNNGEKFKVSYPTQQSAIMYYHDELLLLNEAISASGARYTNETLQWWTKGQDGTLSTLKPGEQISSDRGIDCQEIDSAAQSTNSNSAPAPSYKLRFISVE